MFLPFSHRYTISYSYSFKDEKTRSVPSKTCCNRILERYPMDDYTLRCLSSWNSDEELAEYANLARERVQRLESSP